MSAPIALFLMASETIFARIWLFKFFKSSTTELDDSDVVGVEDVVDVVVI